MATDFPTDIDAYARPGAAEPMNSPSHSGVHDNAYDAVEAIEAKVGKDSSAVNSSHDYKLSGVTGADKSASLAGTEILTNKTLAATTASGNWNMATYSLTNAYIPSPVITTPQINDTSEDHQYIFAANELTADRIVTLPLLTGGDEFVFKDHTQTLTNKTLTNPEINYTDTTVTMNVKASAYLNSAQTITKDSWDEVDIDTESYDIGSDFNTATHEFTAPVTGYYLVIGQVSYATPEADKRYWAALNLNNAATPTIYYPAHASSTSGLGIPISSVIYVTASTLISLYTRCNTTANEALSTGSLATFLNVHLLSV